MKTQLKLSSILSEHKRGSALLMALVVTIVLFILGITFVSTTTTEKSMVSNPDFDITLNDGIEDVLSKITDLMDDDAEWRYDHTDGAHRWLASLEPQVFTDSTGDELYCWPQITDLWGQFNRNINNPRFDPDLRGNPLNTQYGQYDNLGDDSRFLVTRVNSVINVVADDKPILNTLFYNTTDPIDPLKDSIEGMGADADGDGLTDSRWTILDGQRGSNGEYLFAAARVIDNGGMINVNTAYRRPTAAMGYWDGTRLGHVSLDGVTNLLGINPAFLHEKFRCEKITTAFNDDEYELYVAQRFMNPYMPGAEYYLPFGFADEMELRNRLLLTSSSRARLEYALTSERYEPVNFKNATPGFDDKNLPYLPVGDGSQLDNTLNIRQWADYLTPNLAVNNDIYNTRHLLTTYSLDLNRRPESNIPSTDLTALGMKTTRGNRKSCIKLPNNAAVIADPTDVKHVDLSDGVLDTPGEAMYLEYEYRYNYIKELAGSIYRGLPDHVILADRFGLVTTDSLLENRFGLENTWDKNDHYRAKLALTYALNLIDYQDIDIDYAQAGNPDVKRVSAIENVEASKSTEVYRGVESLDDLVQNTLCISKIGYIEITDAHMDPADPLVKSKFSTGKYYAIELFNPDPLADKNFHKSDEIYEIWITDKEGKIKGKITTSTNFVIGKSEAGNGKYKDNTKVIVFAEKAANPGSRTPLDLKDSKKFINDSIVLLQIDPADPPVNIQPSDTKGTPVDLKLQDDDKIIILRQNYQETEADAKIRYNGILALSGTPAVSSFIAPLTNMPVDEVPYSIGNAGPDTLKVIQRNKTFLDSHILMPVDGSKIIWDVTPATVKMGDDIDPDNTDPTNGIVLETFVGDFDNDGITFDGFDTILFDATNTALKNIGEITEVTPLGSYYYYGQLPTDTADFLLCENIMQGYLNSYLAIKNAAGAKDIEYGQNMVTYGKFDLTDSAYHGLMDYLTYFDPSSDGIDNDGNQGIDEDNELVIAGRININTAPWYVIAQLPWLQNNTAATLQQKMRLARAIVAYRDKKALVIRNGFEILTDYLQNGDNIIVSYCEDFANNGNVANAWKTWYDADLDPDKDKKLPKIRRFGMGLNPDTNPPSMVVREEPGFASIAELLNVTHHLTTSGLASVVPYNAINAWADIRQWAKDINTKDNTAINNNVTESYASPFCDKIDDPAKPVGNNYVERDILFNRISNLVTTRSDVFTAYIVVRLGWNGPQKRIIATIDRSSGTPKIVSEYQVPAL
ncbi:MAG: hypothetical protein K9M57_03930 [Phycisphaerae bacterium]|nr:hypothetical protein [Phycisphaerae bacterium]